MSVTWPPGSGPTGGAVALATPPVIERPTASVVRASRYRRCIRFCPLLSAREPGEIRTGLQDGPAALSQVVELLRSQPHHCVTPGIAALADEGCLVEAHAELAGTDQAVDPFSHCLAGYLHDSSPPRSG